MKKILFVCNANCNRSPTFERYFTKLFPEKEFNIRSAGIYHGYPFQVTKQILDWADIVFVMTMPMVRFIGSYYPEALDKVYILGIEDEYDPDDKRLIELIDWWVQTKWKNLPKPWKKNV